MKKIVLHRWTVVLAFVCNVAAIVIAVILLTSQINQLHHDKASIQSLQHTNCRLYTYLNTSAQLRTRLAEKDKTKKARKKDLKAAHIAHMLADSFANELCPK